MSNEQAYYENPALWTPERYEGPNAERTKLTIQQLPSDVTSVLDTGCGSGVLTNQLQGISSVVGIDRSMAALQWVETPRCQADISRLPFADGAFDALISNEVLEHLPVLTFAQALAEMARVARRYILVTVPYQEKRELNRTTCSKCGCQFHANYHMRSFFLKDLQNLFGDWASIKLVKAEGIVPAKSLWFRREWTMMRYNLFHRGLNFPWSAKCPQCGYSSSELPSKDILERQQSYRGFLKSIINPIWPKKVLPLWWLALYVKR